MIEDPFWNYVVLGCAFVFESISWVFGWRAFRTRLGKQGPLQAIHRSKDPTVFIVVLEDSAAIAGLLIAFLGVFFGHLWSNPYLDGTASILIGVMLAFIAALLAYETKGLLIGEGYDRKTLQELREIIGTDQAIDRINRLLTLFFGPDDVMVTVEVKFRDRLTTPEIRAAAKRIRQKLKAQHSEIKSVYFAAENIVDDSSTDSLEFNPRNSS